METVKTSEALEKQILDDARAKARRIREAAEKERAAILSDVQRRDAEEMGRLETAGKARLAALRADLEASLPLDLKRLRLDFFQKQVVGALEELFRSLEPGERDRVLGGMVARAAFAFVNQRVVVRCSGISADDGRRIVTANVAGVQVVESTLLDPEAMEEAGTGLFLQTADLSRRLRATLKELSALLLEEHREQLVHELFGKDVQI
jgi:V/A-type H+/Na+-transporting ATPase subunit E